MPKFLARIVCLLVVTCLAADPSIATGALLTNPLSRHAPERVDAEGGLFTCQAMALGAADQITPIPGPGAKRRLTDNLRGGPAALDAAQASASAKPVLGQGGISSSSPLARFMLAIIHAGPLYDPSGVSKKPIQSLIGHPAVTAVVESIPGEQHYELMGILKPANPQSHLSHGGLQVAQNNVFGKYIWPLPTHGSFDGVILTGGDAHRCLIEAFKELIAELVVTSEAPLELHLPFGGPVFYDSPHPYHPPEGVFTAFHPAVSDRYFRVLGNTFGELFASNEDETKVSASYTNSQGAEIRFVVWKQFNSFWEYLSKGSENLPTLRSPAAPDNKPEAGDKAPPVVGMIWNSAAGRKYEWGVRLAQSREPGIAESGERMKLEALGWDAPREEQPRWAPVIAMTRTELGKALAEPGGADLAKDIPALVERLWQRMDTGLRDLAKDFAAAHGWMALVNGLLTPLDHEMNVNGVMETPRQQLETLYRDVAREMIKAFVSVPDPLGLGNKAATLAAELIGFNTHQKKNLDNHLGRTGIALGMIPRIRGEKQPDAQPILVAWMEEQSRRGRLDERAMKEIAYALGTVTDSVFQRLPELIGLLEMDIGDGGATLTSASHFAAGVLARVGETRMEEAPALPNLNQDPVIKRSSLAELFPGARKVHFERRMGRTLIFNVDGRKIALKLLKKGERRQALGREAILNSWIGRNKRRLRLWSRYPKPLGQTAQGAPVLYDFALEGLPEAAQDAINTLPNQVNALGHHTMEVNVEEGWVEALVYEADDDYFTYLSAPDLSEARFSNGLRRAMHDLFILARHGLFHRALIDAFHAADGPNGRRFRWMVDLLIRSVGGGYGTGRLNAFLEAVRYANIRVSGLADLGDIATFDEIVGELRRFPLMKHLSAAKVKAHALLSMLGEYWLAAVLVHGPRLHNQTGEFGDPEALAKSFERDVLRTSLAAFTQWPIQVVRKALENANSARLGLQMNLFLTKRYVPFLRPRRRPTAIEHSQVFPEHAKVWILSYGLGQWDENVGFISRLTASQPALGPVCGPFLISEIIDISYRILAPLIFMMSSAAKPSAEPAQRQPQARRAA